MNSTQQKVFIVYNPKSGHADQAEDIHALFASHFTAPEWAFEVHEITGKDDDVAAACREACKKGASLVIAAGGDGTVIDVANALVHSKIPLGILPMGTGNDLARVLGIPLKINEALDLLVNEHTIIEVDALKVGERHFFSNVSVGITPHIMNETKTEQKKRFGRLAYLWTVFKRSNILRLRRYTLSVDGQSTPIRAAEVLVSNTTLLEAPPNLFGPPETINDGQLDIYLVTAQNLRDYLRMAWDLLRHPGQSISKLHHWKGQKRIRIDAVRHPQLVQADGEVIGHTPVEVEIVPKAVHVIMPKAAEATA